MTSEAPREHARTEVRGGAAAALLAGTALLLLLMQAVLLAIACAAAAIWLGVRARRAGGASAAAITGIALGGVVGLFGLLVIAGGFALEQLGEQMMPGVVEEHRATLHPELQAAAEAVYPCEGRIDGVELQGLYTQHPELGGRPVLTIEEAALARVDVTVDGTTYPGYMTRARDGTWSTGGGALTPACEALSER
jgi:hypothetical protein